MGFLIDEPGRFAVRRTAFVDVAVAERERTHLFERTWVYVGHTSEVPREHDFVRRQVAGREVILVRGGGGVLRVLHNSCRHRGAEVCLEAAGNAKRFRCPYHGWVYDTGGDLVRGPKGADRGLEALQVGTYRGLVFASVAAQPTLEAHLAPVRPWLDLVLDQGEHGMELVAGVQRYRAEANWKLLTDNSVDIQHVPWLHQRWLAAMRADGAPLHGTEDPGGTGHALEGGHAAVEYDAPWGRLVARWSPSQGRAWRGAIEARRERLIARLGAERGARIADRSRNLLVFPNLVLNDLMAVTLRRIRPVGPAALEVEAAALAPVGEPAELRALRLERFLHFFGPAGFAHADDLAVIESCQRGMAPDGAGWSEYGAGLGKEAPAAGDEAQMRGFWRAWAGYLETP